MTDRRYLVAGCKPWTRKAFNDAVGKLSGHWEYVSNPTELEHKIHDSTEITRIYFLHWSWKVPRAITDRFECINFHMTDLPFGRGGSPLQNLLMRGFSDTVLTAFRMTDELDAGPVYLKRPLSLQGSAASIYERSAALSVEMIQEIERGGPSPVAQEGTPSFFARRTPIESEITEDLGIEEFYNFVRMLDAETYPKAFITTGKIRLEFFDANFDNGVVEIRARVVEG